MLTRRPRTLVLVVFLLLTLPALAAAQALTTPQQHFGFEIGDDYQLATYDQFAEYWRLLDKQSDRVRVVEIGQTAEGRPQLMAIVTSPENFKQLDRYKEISRRLATADVLDDDHARALAKEGKAVVWIDGGLHATEVLGSHQLIETVYQLASRSDPETLRFLNDLIILAVHANPDGMQLVSNWYMREKDPLRRSMNGLPRLYEKYAGHDNNRDLYMSNLPESTNMNQVLYREWFPQIVYDHHQTGPAGAVMFAPPFRDPFNFNFDPLAPIGVDIVGAAIANRMVAEGKPGVTSRKGSTYSTWWNGGLRTTPYFHNMIGLLTETIGSPTPVSIPFVPAKLLPDSNLYFPIEPQQTWHFRQSIDYSVTANYAVFDVASRNKDTFLYGIYQMGKNSIERGNRDTWTMTPRRIIAAQASLSRTAGRGGRAAAESAANAEGSASGGRGRGGPAATLDQFTILLRDPNLRDPRGFILPSDQPDFPTATTFINALIKTGITVHRATAPFTVNGKAYPAGSYVVKAAQPFRPHVLDMFEPQDHPDDIPYPGGPPTRPYDNAGWTLAYQMSVMFDRVLDGFDGPFEKLTGVQRPAPGRASQSGSGAVVLSHATNNAFIAVNRLLAAGRDVRWIQSGDHAFHISGASQAELQKLASELGVTFEPAPAALAAGDAITLRPLRIGLADQYGGSMPSGWTRFVLEQFEFPFEVVYPKTLEAGRLSSRFDVLIFPSGVGPAPSGGQGGGAADRGSALEDIPAEYQPMLGSYTANETGPQLRRFVEDGGTILAVGRSAANLAQLFDLPIGNHLVERSPDGMARPLPTEKYYVPGSILSVALDGTAPIAHGFNTHVDVFFDNSPVFTLQPDATMKGIRPIAWFDTAAPLRSGWAYGQGYLKGGTAIVQAAVGSGRLVLFAPEITFRAQPHGTFKLLFNGIYLAARRTASPASAVRGDR